VYENLLLYVVMDRCWINGSQISDVYEKDIEEFLQFVKWNGTRINERYYFMCVNCLDGND